MKKLLVIIGSSLVLGLAACGGDDDDAEPADNGQPAPAETTPAQPETGTEEPGQAAQRFEVEVVDIDYEPNEARIASGTTVTFTNTGDLQHTVTKESGPGDDFDSGTMDPGDTFRQTFEEPGTVEYFCRIHDGQEGTLTVE